MDVEIAISGEFYVFRVIIIELIVAYLLIYVCVSNIFFVFLRVMHVQCVKMLWYFNK